MKCHTKTTIPTTSFSHEMSHPVSRLKSSSTTACFTTVHKKNRQCGTSHMRCCIQSTRFITIVACGASEHCHQVVLAVLIFFNIMLKILTISCSFLLQHYRLSKMNQMTTITPCPAKKNKHSTSQFYLHTNYASLARLVGLQWQTPHTVRMHV